MFQTTIWSTIHKAGDRDPGALERFAERYRAPVLRFVRSRGFSENGAEDVCQEVFVRILAGDVLALADGSKGRFRSLMRAIATHVIQDRRQRRKEIPVADLDPGEDDPKFDREWILHLTEACLRRLREEGSPYYEVLREHLSGNATDRNKLWIAHRKLIALIRDQIALTCAGPAEFEEEVAYLSTFLRPEKSMRP